LHAELIDSCSNLPFDGPGRQPRLIASFLRLLSMRRWLLTGGILALAWLPFIRFGAAVDPQRLDKNQLAQQVSTTPSRDRSLTPEQAVKFRRPFELSFSPEGSRLVCTISEVKGPKTESHLWILDNAAGELRQFTYSAKSEHSPAWSPDSRTLAFLSNRGEHTQIYLMPADGGEASPLTNGSSDVNAFHWSPDGAQIAFLAREPKTELQEKKEKENDDGRVADQDQDLDRLWIVDVASKKAWQVTKSGWRIDEFEWLATDKIIAVATNKPKAESWTNVLYSVSPADGKFVPLSQPNQPFGKLTISPGKTKLSFVATRNGGPIPHDLFIQNFAGGSPANATRSLDRVILDTSWQDDRTAVIRVIDGFYYRLYRVTGDGAPAPIELPCSVRAFAVSHDGRLAYVGVGFDRLPELFLTDVGGNSQQKSHLHKEWEGIHLADANRFWFKSFDGTRIEAALMKPALATKRRNKLPLVLLVHGGPSSNFSADYFWFNSWPQLLVTRGYEVLMVNPRGSAGYGEEFLKANRADWGGGDFKDLMLAVDAVLAQGETDADHIGIGGWSYGGEMSTWAITQTNRFKAAVVGGGVFDQVAEFETEDRPAGDEWFFGSPWDHPEIFARNSPSSFIRNAKTPTLIVHGEDDHANPVAQAMGLYRALKHYGVETELVVYPREPHGPREEKHQIDILRRMLDWFDRFVLAGPAVSPSRNHERGTQGPR
jgi:dipeptidyl aminopeptidase/acylaminoacyl peptidase